MLPCTTWTTTVASGVCTSTFLSGKASQRAAPTSWFISMVCLGYVVDDRLAWTLKEEKSPNSPRASIAAEMNSASSSPHL